MKEQPEKTTDETVYHCEDCEWHGTASDMDALDDAVERAAVGELMPPGQCPECGSLIGVADEDVPDYTLRCVAEIMRARGWGVVEPEASA